MADDTHVAGGPVDSRASLPNKIVRYFHCARCLRELPEGQSPRDWAQLEVGMTETGVQVWCKRHNINVLNLTL